MNRRGTEAPRGKGRGAPLAALATLAVLAAVGLGFAFQDPASLAALRRQGAAATTNNWDGLYTNLVSFWKLTEASGTRNDSHGANHLTETGTVFQTNDFVYSTAALGTNTSTARNLSVAISESTLPWSYAFWIYPNQTNNARIYMAAENSDGVNGDGWNLWVYGGNIYSVFASNASAAQCNLGSVQINSTNLVVIIRTSAGAFYSKNNGAITAWSPTAPAWKTHNDLRLLGRNAAGSVQYAGAMSSAAYWNRALTTNDIAQLWNAMASRKLY